VSTAIASLRFSLALRLSFLSTLRGPLTARVARRVSMPQLKQSHRSAYGWPHFDCFQATLLSSYLAYLVICNCCVSTATANRTQAWPCGQALSMIWTAYAVLCVPQLLCVHSDCIIVFQPSLAAKRSLYSLYRLPPALHGVQQFSNCISAWPYGQAHAFSSFGPLTACVARRVSVPQLY